MCIITSLSNNYIMRINSELPNQLLPYNNDLNEYDFVLYHLYISNERYREYYLNQRREHPNRLMILDNSAYEFFVKGEVLNKELYVDVINELKPNIYILPDSLMDFEKTIHDTKDFLDRFRHDVGLSKPMAVVQGDSVGELLACMALYDEWEIESVAIPFHNSFYKNVEKWSTYFYQSVSDLFRRKYGKLTQDMMYAIGRVCFVLNFEQYFSSRHIKHIHFLGSHCPLEKSWYKDVLLGRMKTMDTGYPVKCALAGYKLLEEPEKPNIIIDEFIDKELDVEVVDLIKTNMGIFKKF